MMNVKIKTNMNIYRTHICEELHSGSEGMEVTVAGWIHRKRNHGGLLFLDIRDHSGLLQCVFTPKDNDEKHLFENAAKRPLETVVQVKGMIIARDKTTQNKNLSTGMIELRVTSLTILGEVSHTLPFPIAGAYDYGEDERLEYRFLDIRREEIQQRIQTRSAFLRLLRNAAHDKGFIEVQTPILTSSSPEGARDFLVPSRLHRGRFYALPQAPQLFKQFLMIGGVARYFQIAPCFRDEDARADRTPGEFYQLDMEMSFSTQDEIMETSRALIEPAFKTLKMKGWDVLPSWPTISYAQAMDTYGTDSPDLRNPIKLCDVSRCFHDSEFHLFRKILKKGGIVKGIPAPKGGQQPRSFFDEMNAWARQEGAGGLAYIIFDSNGVPKGPIARFLKQDAIDMLMKEAGLSWGDALFFACDQKAQANAFAGKARVKIARRLALVKEKCFHFCWVTDIPLYEHNGQDYVFAHNPFSMPHGGMDALTQSSLDPASLLAHQYDLVCNGIEISSGAIRAHQPDILLRTFAIAGYSKQQIEESFSALFRALRMGAPPHGGIAHGIERMLMLLSAQENVREVIAFPMNQKAQDIMMGAPSVPSSGHLKELGIDIREQE